MHAHWAASVAFAPCDLASPRSPPVRSRRAPRARMGVDLALAYSTARQDHYFATTAVQAVALVSTGDALAQLIELRTAAAVAKTNEGSAAVVAPKTYDPIRTLRMGLLGMVIGGFGTARWLQFLEQLLPADVAVGGEGYSGSTRAACAARHIHARAHHIPTAPPPPPQRSATFRPGRTRRCCASPMAAASI